MSSVIYAIVFSGEILDGHEIISVKAHLAKMLKVNPEQLSKLFSGNRVVLKKTPDKELAIKYGTALKKVGADVKVKVIKPDAAATAAPAIATAPTAPKASPQSQAIPAPKPRAANPASSQAAAIPTPTAAPPATTNLSVVPNDGNIFDAKPEAPRLDIDLSELHIAEPGEGLLTEPKEFVELDIDLSGLDLSEAGEGLLAEPKPEAPKVEAPDFGLDEPGALLETLHEEVELLNPDTSGLTMAMPGTELLPDEEKPPEPEAVKPDISKIHLVPNFDI